MNTFLAFGSSNPPYIDAVYGGPDLATAAAARCLQLWLEVLPTNICSYTSLDAFASASGVSAAARDSRIHVIAFEEFPSGNCGSNWYQGDTSLLQVRDYVKSIDSSKYVGWVDRPPYTHAAMDFSIGELYNGGGGVNGDFYNANSKPSDVRRIYDGGGTIIDLPWSNSGPGWPGGPQAIINFIVSTLSSSSLSLLSPSSSSAPTGLSLAFIRQQEQGQLRPFAVVIPNAYGGQVILNLTNPFFLGAAAVCLIGLLGLTLMLMAGPRPKRK